MSIVGNLEDTEEDEEEIKITQYPKLRRPLLLFWNSEVGCKLKTCGLFSSCTCLLAQCLNTELPAFRGSMSGSPQAPQPLSCISPAIPVCSLKTFEFTTQASLI